MKKFLLGAGATAAMLHSGFALSQVAVAAADAASGPATSSEDLQSVIVTGTRTQGLKAVDSSAPVQVIDSATLRRTGQTDLMQALAQNVPSFTAQALGGDTANLTLSARLRGLSPNQTLLLVNGKRRHGTANLAVLGGPYQGGAAADLNFIPLSAIDHVEVLTEGAAAQYGTDAIAGVVNIILKSNDQGGSVSGTGGGYLIDGGGHTGSLTGNVGLAPIENGYLNLSAETRYHGFSNRGNPDARFFPTPSAANANAVNFPGYPYQNRINGDAAYHLNIFSANAGYEFVPGQEVYTILTYGHKDAEAFENYRGPGRAPKLYPLGFNPEEAITEDDYSGTLGVKGKFLTDWRYDLSSTWGRDDAKLRTLNSANLGFYSAGLPTPTNFDDGLLRASQMTNNLDIGRDFELGLAKPVNLAVGAEQRTDRYRIYQGQPESYQNGGASSYPGFAPTDAGSHDRSNWAAYIDLAATPVSSLNLDFALRHEHFSDFGSVNVGKVTGRWDIVPQFAVRGTVSNGFRAPTLAEEYYRSTNVGPTTTFAQFAPNSIGAAAIGVNGLKPERSINYSAGLVITPSPNWTTTIDAYQILIRDRIVGSGNVVGYLNGAVVSQRVLDAIAANGNPVDPAALGSNGQVGLNIFTNAAKSRNRGVDVVSTYPADYGAYGRVDWSVGGNYNQVKLLGLANVSSVLPATVIFDQTAESNLTTASPKYRVNVAGLWRLGMWTVNLRETLYGPSSRYDFADDGNYYLSKISPKLLTDLEVAAKVTPQLTFAVGANNLFNTYPQGPNGAVTAAAKANGDTALDRYNSFSPFGINGGYYYARATYTF